MIGDEDGAQAQVLGFLREVDDAPGAVGAVVGPYERGEEDTESAEIAQCDRSKKIG